jgi:hypothetical protein
MIDRNKRKTYGHHTIVSRPYVQASTIQGEIDRVAFVTTTGTGEIVVSVCHSPDNKYYYQMKKCQPLLQCTIRHILLVLDTTS